MPRVMSATKAKNLRVARMWGEVVGGVGRGG
jgi:hypothetical protein